MLPPSAPRRAHTHVNHGQARVDFWSWLDDTSDPDVIAYLEAENAFARAVMAPTVGLQESLFEGIRARTRETDAGPPSWSDGWWYYTRSEKGLQYPIDCRLADDGRRLDAGDVARLTRSGRPRGEQTLLDANRLVGSSGYLDVGILDVSPGGRVMAYGVDLDGSELFTVHFRDLNTMADLDDRIAGAYYSSAWNATSDNFLYVKPDESMRPWQVWCHRLGSDTGDDRLVYQEDDERFFVEVSLTRSGSRIVIAISSKTSSEVRWLDSTWSSPPGAPQVLLERRADVDYEVDHDSDSWLVKINLTAEAEPAGPGAEHSLWRIREGERSSQLEPVLAPRPDVAVVDVDAFSSFIAVTERSTVDGLERVRIIERSGRQHLVEAPASPYALLTANNPDWEQGSYRYGYTSLVTPRTWVDHAVRDGRDHVVWVQDVQGGYDPSLYRTHRLWAVASDSTRVPISVVCRADHTLDGTAPGVLYGYGAYEISSEPTFSAATLNLLDRGVVFAIAHVRGGGELGRGWHDAGRMRAKVNTFTDFVACAEAIIEQGWVSRDRIAARGASAGGLLMGAVTNMRPELWRAVVAEVPFVDVVTTMSDPTLPLTVTEWEEWGDPLHDPSCFEKMLSYSPYDNVIEREQWPAMYVTAGLHDPRVGFWEPAKWVAKLRWAGAGTSDRPLLLFTEMGAGHQGPSGRYEGWRDEARVQAFILTQLQLPR